MDQPKDAAGAPVHSIVLLPCPFCGSEKLRILTRMDSAYTSMMVQCKECKATGGEVFTEMVNDPVAIAKLRWNSRPTHSKIDIQAEAERLGVKEHDPIIGLIGR